MEFPELIDNKDESRRLDLVLGTHVFVACDSVEIAVGYFYFSGFQLIADSLAKNANLEKDGFLKFIISPQTDQVTAQILKQGFSIDPRVLAIREFENDLLQSEPKWADFLVDLLRRKKVQVRIYTKDFFHAKAYMASIPNPINNTSSFVSIVGSSNFSQSGLTGNRELNLGTRADYLYKQLKDWFYDLWENHTEDFSESLLEVVESSGFLQRKEGHSIRKFISTFEMLLFLLKHYLGRLTEENPVYFDQLAEFQRIGTENIFSKLERYGGAIVADSVGLGKTFTAGEVVRRYRLADKKVIVLCPPKLLNQWKETLETHFGVYESKEFVIYSQGKFAQLEQGKVAKEFSHASFDLIVIDEAHRFRNKETMLYQNVNELHPYNRARRADVLLLTATPFNNSIQDLQNLIDLSITQPTLTNAGFSPRAFSDFSDLMKKLKEGFSLSELKERGDFQKSLSGIQEILNAVMLLRMRSTIKEKYGKITIAGKPLQFDDPVVEKVLYKYERKHHKLFEALSAFLGKLHLPHIAFSNANLESGKVLCGLYLLLLFKRIESSIYAFYISLQNIITKEEALRKALETSTDRKEILEKYEKFLKGKSDDEFELFESKDESQSSKLESFDRAEIISQIDSDIKAINDFIKKHIIPLFADSTNPLSIVDPKFDYYLVQIKGRYKKCLTFTEFKSTIDYLEFQVNAKIQKGELQIPFAVTSGEDKEINSKLDRFAPRGRNVDFTQKDSEFQELDLLISTDVLSEGVNLQDADLLINYDLPWNPMKIVQRIGRVNRIGSDNKIRVLNFIPDEVLGEFIQLVEILSHKIKQVSLLLGKEMAILSSEEEEINPRTIGEELQNLRDAKNISEIESLSHKSELFNQVAGETDEDIFRMQLHLASKENLIRKEDYSILNLSDELSLYTIVNKNYKKIYHLYEIYGSRKDRRDLLSRFWLCISETGEITEKQPDEFFTQTISREIVSLQDLENKSNFYVCTSKLQEVFQIKLEKRKETNSPKSASKRMANFSNMQINFLVLLEEFFKEQTLGNHSFIEVARSLSDETPEILEDLLSITKTQVLDLKSLKVKLEKKGFSIDKKPNVSKYKELIELYVDYYNTVILQDSTIRGYLYKSSEITGQLIAGILI